MREGEPCPICGSTHHPAKRSIPDNICEKLRDVEARINDLQNDIDLLIYIYSRKDLINRDRQNHVNQQKELEALGTSLCQHLGRESVVNFLKSPDLEKHINKAQELRDKIQEIERNISQIEGFLESLRNETQELEKKSEDLKNRRNKTEAQLLQLLPESIPWYQTFWQLLREKGLSEAEQWAHKLLTSANEELEEYDHLRKMLYEDNSPYKNLPLTHEIEEQVHSLSKEHRDLQEEIDRGNREKGELQVKLQQKHDLMSQIERAEKELESISAELTLIKKVSGTVSAGELEKFFVRELLLRPLLEEVNGYLREWLGGALELQMAEEPSGEGSKRDELLQIRDVLSAQGEPRSPHTLSGGEKFLVSLAMALALSHRIMSMKSKNPRSQPSFFFIDEGFDTLSTENFDFVMRTLQRLVAQGRCIGLISHKIEAREYLSAYLKVEKENHTTRVKLCQNTHI